MRRGIVVSLCVALLLGVTPAKATEEEVRAAVAAWYAELRKGRNGRISTLLAPNGIIEPRLCPDRCGPQPRALKPRPGPPFPHLLAVRAELFQPEIEKMKVEGTLARVDVWERGFIYAWASKVTYENAAGATFILERGAGEHWKVLLYSSRSSAVRPDHANQPIPDLSPEGKSRTP
jgi:hypothetical protein